MSHSLTKKEKELSEQASKTLGIRVQVYQDVNWICETLEGNFKDAYNEPTPEKAISVCAELNGWTIPN